MLEGELFKLRYLLTMVINIIGFLKPFSEWRDYKYKKNYLLVFSTIHLNTL